LDNLLLSLWVRTAAMELLLRLIDRSDMLVVGAFALVAILALLHLLHFVLIPRPFCYQFERTGTEECFTTFVECQTAVQSNVGLGAYGCEFYAR